MFNICYQKWMYIEKERSIFPQEKLSTKNKNKNKHKCKFNTCNTTQMLPLVE